MQLVDHPYTTSTSTFTTADLARLAAYRAAMAAGFFSAWDGSAARTDTEMLACLPRSGRERYPFTTGEPARCEQLHGRLTAGEPAHGAPRDLGQPRLALL